jgi:hypothetical protein
MGHGAPLQLNVFLRILQRFIVSTLSEACVLHGFLSLHTTFTVRFDAQALPCLIVLGGSKCHKLSLLDGRKLSALNMAFATMIAVALEVTVAASGHTVPYVERFMHH